MTVLIDTKKCTCKTTKLCRSVCPYGFIWGLDEMNFPGILPDLEHYCIACGHCECICPSSAVKVEQLAGPSVEFDKKLKIHFEQVKLLLKTRRSVRTFKKTPIPREEILALLDITRWIPTASNKQQVRWLVIDSRDKLKEISRLTIDFLRQSGTTMEIIRQYDKGQDIILRNAPHLIIALGEQNYFWGSAEAGIALTYLELYAHAKNLGTCWAGFFTRAANSYEPLRDYLDLPKNHQVFGSIMAGYPVFKLHSIPFRNPLSIEWR